MKLQLLPLFSLVVAFVFSGVSAFTVSIGSSASKAHQSIRRAGGRGSSSSKNTSDGDSKSAVSAVASRQVTCDRYEVNSEPLQAREASERTPRIYDVILFAFEGELPVLELRLVEMAAELDLIYIVEGDRDFQGRPRKLLLPRLMQEEPLRRFAGKIKTVTVSLPELPGHKGEETYEIQGHMVRALHNAVDDISKDPGLNSHQDFVIAGDLDEIVSRHTLRALKDCRPHSASSKLSEWPMMMIDMDLYFINFGWRDMNGWTKSNTIFHPADVSDVIDAPKAHISHATKISNGTHLVSVQNNLRTGSSDGTGMMAEIYSEGFILPTHTRLLSRWAKPPGWHLSWSLDAANTANKLASRAGGLPSWAVGLSYENLVKQTAKRLAAGPKALINSDAILITSTSRLPDAVQENPIRFRRFLSDDEFRELRHNVSGSEGDRGTENA